MQELITPSEARDKGLKHYFTGRPCKHGHVDRRDTKGGRCLGCSREAQRRKGEVEGWKAAEHRRQKYGLGTDGYDALLQQQDHVCAGCLKPFVGAAHVDHDHKTGRVRGLLCRKCNVALGMADDQPDILIRLAAYLTRS